MTTCAVCEEELTAEEEERVNADTDFVEHGDRGHLIRVECEPRETSDSV